jgi:N-acetylmuramoyl-L-alanine amidase
MSYPIRKAFLEGLPKIAYRKGISAYEGVVAHSTATPEATDERELEYFKANWKTRQAFAHFFVDWDSITQMADTDYKAWGAGNGNPRFVHVELCETKDEAKFKESYMRYVWLLADILKKKNLGVTDGGTLVSHAWVSDHLGGTDHRDPLAYLKYHGVSWGKLVADVKATYAPKPDTNKAVYHTVDKDETFWSLENELKLKHGTLQKLNPKVDPGKLHEGKKIRVK